MVLRHELLFLDGPWKNVHREDTCTCGKKTAQPGVGTCAVKMRG